MAKTPRVAVAGIHGHGRTHVAHVRELVDRGEAEFAATIDPVPPQPDQGEVVAQRHCSSVPEALETGGIDVLVLCTPIATHCDLAIQALDHGVDVLLEKPTTASLDEFHRLAGEVEASGRLVQVGFQSLGSTAIPWIRREIERGHLGEVDGVFAVGEWIRSTDYWNRAAWAGRRVMGGVPVVDGVITNPFAHAFATALAMLRQGREEDVVSVDLDQYRANDIEADDTSTARIETMAGVPITAALTVAGERESDPIIEVRGSEGSIRLSYTTDVATVRDQGGAVTSEKTFGRALLLDNLLAARSGEADLLVPVGATGGFMRILEAVRTAPDPAPINPRYVDWRDDGRGHHPVVLDVERWLWQCARQGKSFSDAGAPWALRDDV